MKEKKEINVQIGNEIRNARERAGLTQAEFGEMMSLDTKNVSDIERGVTGIKLSTLKRICEGMSISSDALLFGDQDKNDVSYMAEKLSLLPRNKFLVIESLINKILETYALLGK
ncbi:MAG: helix-turn-helix transcriptional regulator [Clostridia bacterium]|nr:helix-turn-helix transcriptional regulator [Clostridia bacterium]